MKTLALICAMVFLQVSMIEADKKVTKGQSKTTKCSHWVNPPSAAARKATPGLVHEILVTDNMPDKVGYSVVLPEGYVDSDRRYPVVY